MYYHRQLEDRLVAASAEFPALLLVGPRQVGKTTLLQHICGKDRRYVTLDDPASRELANGDPGLFLQRYPPPVLIDEIQYAPGLLPRIKMHVDAARKTGAFWLTGSQQFHMMKGVSESLAGRVAIVNLLGFSARERDRLKLDVSPFLPTPERLAQGRRDVPLGETEIYERIWSGSLPALIAGPARDRNLFLGSYVQTYLQRDVRDLAQVGNQETFLRFLRACSARTGQLLNLTDLARDVDVSVMTARSWLAILVTSLQVFLLQPYHSNVTKRLIKRPKLYFLDTGVAAYLTEWSSPQTLAAGAMAGPMLETFVFAEILKSWWHRMERPLLYYYRDKDSREIDLLLVHDRVIHPVEIKRSGSPRAEWVRPFAALGRLEGQVGPGAVVCLTPELVPLDADNAAVPVSWI
jgi:predicted AAA+ superfamily ATPase